MFDDDPFDIALAEVASFLIAVGVVLGVVGLLISVN